MIMKQAAQLLRGILPTELQARLEGQPDSAIEYAEPGFSLSLLKRVSERLSVARRRIAFAQEEAVKQNLAEIIELLEDASCSDSCPLWQGYFMEGSRRIEFVVAPSLSRRVVGMFKAS
jgi:hypothetical protein